MQKRQTLAVSTRVSTQSGQISDKRTRSQALAAAVRPTLETLERRSLMAANPVITEFVASNANGLTDAAGNHPDWIEIQNQGDTALDMAGWRLTDNPAQPAKWTFSSHVLEPGAYMVVLADSSALIGNDSLGYQHTNFSLSADGENLSLRKPDGTVASEFGLAGAVYPKQLADVSYGTTKILNPVNLVVSGAPAKAFVPTTSALDNNAWTLPGFNDATWKSGTTAVGYDGGGTASTANMLARWYAPSLGLANAASVSSWNAVTGTGTASQATSANRPTYRTNQINGKAVVRFDGSNDNLKITNQSLNGLTDFTVAMVFRTGVAGRAGTQWYNNNGIVDAEVGGVTNDWGLVINDAGSIGAGVGNPDTTLYSVSNLNNNQPHVVVFTKTGTTTAMTIDGGVPIYGTAPATARNVNELVFGSLHTNVNYFNGDLGEVRLYNAALNDDAVRSLGNAMSTDWGIAQPAGVYTSKIGLDLQAEMANVASTANIRVPFTVSNPAQFDTLFLNMKYDDGFVAYLNGTEIARRQAPGGAITYTTTASSARADAAALTNEQIDVSSFVNLLQGNGATNVLAIKALNVSATDSDLLITPQLLASSSTTGAAYMTTPTPGAANLPGFAGVASAVTFSVPHGYYNAAFNTTLTTPTVGATIVYTLDGSTPTLTNGTLVAPPASGLTSVTLNVASSKTIRAVAFKDTFIASSVAAASYFFTADIVQQPEATPPGAYWDVGMDADVVNANQTYNVQQALKAIPTISLTIDNAAMFGAESGLYTHPFDKGDDWERPVSVEYFDPNNTSQQFSINAGIRISGAVSRDPSRPKKSFKLFFRSEYGESKLNFPIFGSDNAQTVFDHLIFRAGHSYSWANLGGTPFERADYLRDQFARQTEEAITGVTSRGNFVQLYINGQYWGMYNAVEDVDQDWSASHFGGTAEDYDIIKPDDVGGVIADDGTLDLWNNLFNTADEAYADNVVDNTEYADLASKVDVKNLVDYMLNIFYRGDKDAPVLIGSGTSPRNFIAVVNRADPAAKMRFLAQDGEISLDDTSFDRTGVYGNQNPGRLFQQLATNAEFRQLVVDETRRLFTGNGVLTPNANKARYQALMNQINVAIVGESARWGNAKQATPGMRDTHWVTETNWILNSYMPFRTTTVLNQLTTDFPELSTLPPGVLVSGQASTGGQIPSGATITLNNSNGSPAGTVYYTLDGTDPRATGGGVSTTAIAYASGFTISGAKTLNARVLRNGTWSSLTTTAFTVAPPSLRLAEMMYHPANAVAGGPFATDDYEYIVLANTGTTPIDLGGMQLTAGIFGTIPANTILASGARGVVARNIAAFQYAWGTSAQILGVYTDKLADSSENVRLFDPNSGTNIFDFTYVDAWYPTTDGPGYSLVVRDLGPSQSASTVLGVASAWQASSTPGGSAGVYNTSPTKITATQIDDGTAQKSNVRSITINVNRPVTLAGIQSGAFTLTHLTGQMLPTMVNVQSITPIAGGSAITLTFTQTGSTAASLVDGQYELVISGTKITDTAGALLDAAGTGARGSSKTLTFARLAADADGNAAVNFNDFLILQNAFGTTTGQAGYSSGADADGNGQVNFNDFLILQNNFGQTV